jgi:hypothetical protein
MQNTTNYNLKKPDYTDFADIADINDNMDTIDAQLAAPTGDSANSTTTFTTSDTADGGASSWTNVPALTSGETHKSLFAKMSQMFKNIRFLYKLLGTTDISSIGNGTVTGGLSSLNDSLSQIETFQPGVDPAEWTSNYTNTFSNPITAYKTIMIWAEYNGHVMDFITAPLTFFAGKPVYLGWNDGSLKASAKIQVSSNYGSATVSGFTGFTKVALRGIR